MALGKYFDADPDFFLEELRTERHLYDYHRMWSDPASLIWSTQAPKQNLEETRAWLSRWTKESDARIANYAIMLRAESALNPTKAGSAYGPLAPIFDEAGASSSPSSSAAVSPRPYLIGSVGILRPASHASSDAAAGADTASSSSSSSSPEMGYMIHHTHWGLGLAGRAVRAFLAGYWAVLNPRPSSPPAPSQESRLDTVEAHIDPANAASEQIARRAGFVPGESAGYPFRLAHSQQERTLRIWRLQRPRTDAAAAG